jgi:hypothetical protein
LQQTLPVEPTFRFPKETSPRTLFFRAGQALVGYSPIHAFLQRIPLCKFEPTAPSHPLTSTEVQQPWFGMTLHTLSPQ